MAFVSYWNDMPIADIRLFDFNHFHEKAQNTQSSWFHFSFVYILLGWLKTDFVYTEASNEAEEKNVDQGASFHILPV